MARTRTLFGKAGVVLPILLAAPSIARVGVAHGQDAPGSIVAWGDNDYAQCDVPAPNGDFIAVAAGGYHSVGLKADGSVVAWGYIDACDCDGCPCPNEPDECQCDTPEPNADFVAIAAGWAHSLALRLDGSIAAWGSNYSDKLNVPSPNADFVAIAAGDYHSLGLKADGSILAWGINWDGQCDVPAPNADFVAVAAGDEFSLGLKADGSIVAWGANYAGQLNVPAPNSNFAAVAAGFNFSLGLKADGSIVAWECSDPYPLCDVPVPNSDFVGIAGGGDHNLGLKADGSIVAWGDNRYGQTNVPAPNTGFVGVAAGFEHSLGVKCLRHPVEVTTVDDLSGFPHAGAPISLRQAINKANMGCVNEIRFAAPLAGQTIALRSALPRITASEIDILGDINQDGLPDFVISGANLSSGHGLVLRGNNCVLRGLTIEWFPDDGVRLENGASGNRLEGNWILANEQYGVHVLSGSNRNLIGPDNLISANWQDGVHIAGAGTSFNIVWGNTIGEDTNNPSGAPNRRNGIRVTGDASENYIGIDGPGDGAAMKSNIIHGNNENGIHVDSGASKTFMRGNRVWGNGDPGVPAVRIAESARAPRYLPWFVTPTGGGLDGRAYAPNGSIIDFYCGETPTDAQDYMGRTLVENRAFHYFLACPGGTTTKGTVTTVDGTSELNMLPPKLAYIYRNSDRFDIIAGFWDHTALAFLFPPSYRTSTSLVAESVPETGVGTVAWDHFVSEATRPASQNFVRVDMPDMMVNAAFDWVFHNPQYPDELQIPGHADFCFSGCPCQKGLESYTCVGLTERTAEESPLGDIVPSWAECFGFGPLVFMLPTTQLAYLRPGLEWGLQGSEARGAQAMDLSVYRVSGTNIPALGQPLSVFPDARMVIGVIGTNNTGSAIDAIVIPAIVPGTLGGILQYTDESVAALYDDVQGRWVFNCTRPVANGEPFSIDVFLDEEVWESPFDVQFLAGDTVVGSSQGSMHYTRIGSPPGGDLDLNNDVDLADFSVFARCVSGADVRFPPTGCAFTDFLNADVDEDGDVDLDDFTLFHTSLGAP